MNNPIIMHINYLEQGQPLDYVCKKAAELGYDGVEFRRSRSSVPDETPESYIDALSRYSKEYGLKYVLFGGPGINVMTQDKEVIRREIDSYKHFLDAASAKIELSVINFMTGGLTAEGIPYGEYEKHGSACAQEWHWNNAAEACREIADYAPEVKFAFETHMGYLHDLAWASKKLCDMIDKPNFGINLDYGNTVYFAGRIDPLEKTIDICGEKLFYTHMKNSVPGIPRRMPTALSEGEINHRHYVKKLEEVGFKGFIGIEAPRSGDREWYAAQDKIYIDHLVK